MKILTDTERVRALARWREIKRISRLPEVAQVLCELHRLRVRGDEEPVFKVKKVRFDGWLRPFSLL